MSKSVVSNALVFRGNWEFNLEEGLLDSARLARIVANPLHSLTYKQENSADVQYSQCAIDRAIRFSGLAEYAEAEIPGGIQAIFSRAFNEVVR